MTSNLLILHPEAADAAPDDSTALLQGLKELGFLGPQLEHDGGQTHYRPGEAFLQLITFLGCSPVVSLGEPGKTGDEFAHIELALAPEPAFIVGDNAKPPRCPHCGARPPDWKAHIPEWRGAPRARWHCPECDGESTVAEMRWRKCAGYARTFLKVWGIFESEAVPGDRLMAYLNGAGLGPWKYFYYRGPAFDGVAPGA